MRYLAFCIIAVVGAIAHLEGQAPIGGGGFMPTDVFLNDGTSRVQLKWAPAVSSMNMAAAMVPFARAKPYFYLEGDKSEVRLTNKRPRFDVDLPTDMHTDQLVTLVRLRKKNGQRRIDMNVTGMQQIGRATFAKSDVVLLQIESSEQEVGQLQSSVAMKLKPHHLMPQDVLAPGEYALFIGWRFYDFAID
jgi:hypothetical protein